MQAAELMSQLKCDGVGKYEGAGICKVRTRSRPKQEKEHRGHSAVKSHVAEGCHDLLKRGVLSQDTTVGKWSVMLWSGMRWLI
jgi:hypothetical protein